jgi:hypothetical protein
MTLADQLGSLQAEIEFMQRQERELKDAFIDEGLGAYEGDLYDVTVFESDRKTVAWKRVAEKLGATAQMIAGNTKRSITTSVKCTAKKVVS